MQSLVLPEPVTLAMERSSVSDIEQTYRIRTGETGPEALYNKENGKTEK